MSVKKPSRRLKLADRQLKLADLPPMRCDKGCGDCCGPAPVTDLDLTRIKHYMADHGIKANPAPIGNRCPLYQDGACTVYPARPTICRVFGHTYRLECSKGYNTNVPDSEVRAFVESEGPPVGLLSEFL